MSTAPSASASNAYDVIVIGSGIGGLATASILAQVGKRRVLVVERHFKLGGFTHSFRRKDYEWDVGVHYVGEMQPGAMTRRIMDLVTRKGVDWHRIGSPFERFVFPEGTFEVPDDPKLYMQKLIERFPAEEASIRTYFRDLKNAQGWVARWFIGKQLPKWVASMMTFFGKKLVSQTTGEYLSRFKDPLLKAILPAQWPDFGSRPGESAFGFHAAVAADFLNGGFFPIGGSKELANHAAAAITDNGGHGRRHDGRQSPRAARSAADFHASIYRLRILERSVPRRSLTKTVTQYDNYCVVKPSFQDSVISAQAGIQAETLDSRLRGNDKHTLLLVLTEHYRLRQRADTRFSGSMAGQQRCSTNTVSPS